ncbi:MAG: penicillin-binding protein activator, partial [Casimicrobium sp.]
FMLSPSGATPPDNFFVLAPDLESEAEAIARQSLEDACRRPILIDAGGPLALRIGVAVNAYFKSGSVSTPLAQHELGSRDRWQRLTESWRKDSVDCALFAGNGSQLLEFRPFLRNITIYATSASYETELDRIVDWTGVRIADSPFVLDPLRSEFASVAPLEPLTPTLARLYALGIDAARIAFDTVLTASKIDNASNALASDQREPVRLLPPESFNGAIGKLRLQNQQYFRTPSIGEFRGRAPSLIGY